MMTDLLAFLGDKFKAVIVGLSLGFLLLLPASLGSGGMIIEKAFGQSNLSPLDGVEEGGGVEEEPTSLPANASTFLLRGLIGSSLPAQSGDAPIENNSSHIVAGRFRVFANESLVNRFIAEMDLAAINGTTLRNITIEETAPHRFELMESGNGTSTTTATGSVPPVSSNLMTRIYVDSNIPIIDNVSMTISIRGQVLAIEDIDIDETRITDTGQRDILSIIDGQSIFGIVSR